MEDMRWRRMTASKAEDRVLSDVHRFDESRVMSLYSFSSRAIMRAP
jgi:hypothetical protein